MGSITAYESAAGKRYRVRYRKPDHSQTDKRGFRTKREAELFLASVVTKKATGQYIDPTAARATVDRLGVAWLASRSHLKPSSAYVYESAWRLHVEPRWGSVKVGSIRHTEVQAWITELSNGTETKKPKSPTIVRRSHDILAGILDNAVKDHLIPSNPARGVKLPRRVSREHVYLTNEQVAELVAACGDHATIVATLAYTGLRWGEATALRARDVDAARRRLSVVENAVYVNGQIVVGTPKTHESRSVPYPQFLAAPLLAACARKRGDELVFDDGRGGYQRTPTMTVNSWWDRALRKAELPAMTIHDLRHTPASLAVSAGANVKVVQRMLGHASAAMTLDIYSDLFDDDLNAVADRLHEQAEARITLVWPGSAREAG
ncbi:site-specific integrase [Diaminobutyricibacter tongyongensis]|uniref:Site-specific integrase n=1 Tax=Leifsonia tongyongensis TaxID=1268043 RepID=A0A6L9Y1S1_9MICO|nr:tyrosine-type recombinase/integrase [Diaminobutyricibacter tongyongensis]NEN07639.1 site-specific integrase [Diaminobutyricibacter tongyongensis]